MAVESMAAQRGAEATAVQWELATARARIGELSAAAASAQASAEAAGAVGAAAAETLRREVSALEMRLANGAAVIGELRAAADKADKWVPGLLCWGVFLGCPCWGLTYTSWASTPYSSSVQFHKELPLDNPAPHMQTLQRERIGMSAMCCAFEEGHIKSLGLQGEGGAAGSASRTWRASRNARAPRPRQVPGTGRSWAWSARTCARRCGPSEAATTCDRLPVLALCA